MSEQKRKKYTTIGTVMKAKKEKETDADRYYLKLGQMKDKGGNPVENIFPITLANGVKLNEGDILTMFDKKEQFKRLVDSGKMDERKARDLSFLRYDVCVAEEVDTGSGRSSGGADDINF